MNKPYNKKITSEVSLVGLLKHFFINLNYNVYLEVPNSGQSIDLVAKKGRWIICVEAKMGNWKRALEQSLAHEHIADFIYIAIASVNISERLITLVEDMGYGIIHCNPYSQECRIIRKANINNNKWIPQRKVFHNYLRGVEPCHNKA